MSTGRRAVSIALVVGLSACGSAGSPGPDFYVRGAGVVVNSTATFALQPDFRPRIESTVDAALAYWQGTWRILDGMTITLEGERYVPCGGAAHATGCYDGDIRVSTQDAGITVSCVEQTVLVHEIGHAVIGDRDHLDPRWMDFALVTKQLAGRIGYSANGEVSCQLEACVWQHPPGR